MIIVDIEQGSPEWHKVRLGKVTGTRIKDVMKADNLDLVDKIIAEIITDQSEPNFVNAAMQWGIDNEPKAREAYEAHTGHKVDQYGFIIHKQYDWLGMSPDGLIKLNQEDNGYKKAIEIKCPNTSTHVKYIRQGNIPNEYKYQVQSLFLINPVLESLDFISYDPRFTLKPLHIVTITRDELVEQLATLEPALVKFWDKTMKYYQQITA